MPLLRHCAALAVRRGLPSPSRRSAHISSARAPSSEFARVSKCYSTPIGVNTPQSATDPSPAAPPPNLPPPRPTGAQQWADIAPRRAAEGRAARRAGWQRPPSLRNRSVARRRPPDLPPDIAPRRAAARRAAQPEANFDIRALKSWQHCWLDLSNIEN